MCQKDLWVRDQMIRRLLLSTVVYCLWDSVLLLVTIALWSLVKLLHVYVHGNTGVLVYGRFSWLSLHTFSFWQSESGRWGSKLFSGCNYGNPAEGLPREAFYDKVCLRACKHTWGYIWTYRALKGNQILEIDMKDREINDEWEYWQFTSQMFNKESKLAKGNFYW